MLILVFLSAQGSISPLLHLARSGLFRTVRAGNFDGTANVDVVVVVSTGQVVEAAIFGERRQVEGETCGAAGEQVNN